jgi:chemotaxis protein methyltransferase CheR
MTAAEFAAVRDLVHRVVGIALSDAKRTLAESRLARRLRAHGYTSFTEYLEHLERRDPAGEELREFVNCITTNRTSFFREPHHFEFLAAEVFPALTHGAVRVWSAGCSTGEEPYTIAMTAIERAPGGGRGLSVFATDIDTEVLATAAAGVYALDRLEGLDEARLRRHFLRGTGGRAGHVQVRPELRERIQFQALNLMASDWRLPCRFDVILCRNVIIYFDRPTQERLIERFALALVPGGHLILGHSENIHGMGDLFEPLRQTVYRLRGAPAARPASRAAANAAPSPSAVPPPAVPASAAPATRARPARRAAATHGHTVRLPATAAAAGARPVVRIEAGEVHASSRPVEIRTLLGSCVAACLYDPVARVGGMNHFMLPNGSDDSLSPARYGVHAMELLINDIMKMGGSRPRLQAKVFGGAKVIRLERRGPDVGTLNADFVIDFLSTEGIAVAARQLGGTSPLEVRMEADTGRVRVRPLRSELMDRIDAEERRRTQETVAGEARVSESSVTLF